MINKHELKEGHKYHVHTIYGEKIHGELRRIIKTHFGLQYQFIINGNELTVVIASSIDKVLESV